MGIIHLSKFYKPYSGGLESVVSDIAEGIEGSKVLSVDPDNLQRFEEINGVSVFRRKEVLNIASTSLSIGYLTFARKFQEKDICHVHYPNPLASVLLFIAWLLKKDLSRIVIHWHSDIVKQKNLLKLYSPLMNWSLRKAKKIIVTSQNYLECSEQLKQFKSKCVVIPIGIDGFSRQPSIDEVEKIRLKYGGRKVIFSLGRHIYYKGFEYLIKAARYLPEDVAVLIGGKGADTSKYEAMIREYCLEDKVYLVGRVEDSDLPNYYKAAEMFCLPSIEKSEAFGVVQLEAMSLGTPVVSTNILGSGVPWVNKNMESGLICQPKDYRDLADKINSILSSSQLRETLAAGAKSRFSKLFTKDKMIHSIRSLYSEI